MNMNIISKYLQFLRKSNNYTQDDLAKESGISRQAISKWETGATIPNLEVLLKISTISEKELKEVLEQFDTNSLVTALMGASPETNSCYDKFANG